MSQDLRFQWDQSVNCPIGVLLVDKESRPAPVLGLRLASNATWVDTAVRALRRRLAYPDEFEGLQLGLDADGGLVVIQSASTHHPPDPEAFFRRVCNLLDVSGNQTW